MPVGTVKFIKPEEGYGFIVLDGGGPDIYFRVADCGVPTYKLRSGAPVMFDIVTTPRGQRSAQNVILSSDAALSSVTAIGKMKFWDASKGFESSPRISVKGLHGRRRGRRRYAAWATAVAAGVGASWSTSMSR
jgi:cold shock CspA family protein